MKKIYIDAGHGGNSVGAAYKGRREQDDCLRLALAVGRLVAAQGIEVKYSRTADVNPDLAVRCKEANAWGADYFVSIHRNAFKPEQARGAEAWIFSGCTVGGQTYGKAREIVNGVCAATGFANRGVKRGAPSYADYAVNRDTRMDSCLLECGFLDNTGDNRIFDEKFDALALAVAGGLCKAVGAAYKTPASTDGGDLYRVQIGAFGKKENADALAKLAKEKGFDAAVTKIVKGDADGDGRVTAADARAALRLSVGLEP